MIAKVVSPERLKPGYSLYAFHTTSQGIYIPNGGTDMICLQGLQLSYTGGPGTLWIFSDWYTTYNIIQLALPSANPGLVMLNEYINSFAFNPAFNAIQIWTENLTTRKINGQFTYEKVRG